MPRGLFEENEIHRQLALLQETLDRAFSCVAAGKYSHAIDEIRAAYPHLLKIEHARLRGVDADQAVVLLGEGARVDTYGRLIEEEAKILATMGEPRNQERRRLERLARELPRGLDRIAFRKQLRKRKARLQNDAMKIVGSSFRVLVEDLDTGRGWYAKFFGRNPDLEDASGCRWEVAPASWFALARGVPRANSNRIRFTVDDIVAERRRLERVLELEMLEVVDVDGPGGVAPYLNLSDPFGNPLGLFQDRRPRPRSKS